MAARWIALLPSPLRKKVEGRLYLQNVIHNSGWLFADNLFRMGVNLFVLAWVARYLGPEQYGLLSYATAFVALFSPLAQLGLDDIVIRNILRDPSHRNETLGSCFSLKLIAGVISVLCVIAAIYVIRPNDPLSHALVAITAAGTIFQAFTTIEFWFNSQVQAKYLVWSKSAFFSICSLIKIIFIAVEAPLISFAWVGLLELAAGSLGLVIAYRATGNLISGWRSSLSKAGELLRDSWPLMFSSAAMMIYMRIDQIMIGQILGNGEVGIYSVAVRLADVGFFMSMIIYSSVFPSIIEAKSTSESLYYERLQKLYNLMVLVNGLIAIPVTIFARPLIVVLFGEDFAGAGIMLSILIWGNLFNSLELARNSFIATMNYTRINLVTILLGALINIVLNYLLIPHYGGIGAAVASCISYWFAGHGSCFLFRPLYRTGRMLTKALVYPKVW